MRCISIPRLPVCIGFPCEALAWRSSIDNDRVFDMNIWRNNEQANPWHLYLCIQLSINTIKLETLVLGKKSYYL